MTDYLSALNLEAHASNINQTQWVGPGNGGWGQAMEPAKHFNGAQIASNTQQHTTLTPHTAVLEYNVSKVSIK